MSFRWLALGLLMLGCASELVQSARRDELPTFRQKLAQQAKQPSSELDDASLRDVAEAVASRELLTSGPEAAEARVIEVAECAPALQDALEELSEGDGPPAALATQVLIDADLWAGEMQALVRRFSTDPRDVWRATGLRAAVSPDDASVRAKGFLDPDLRVRRAAVRAAGQSRAKAQLPALYEVARLDPDRISRRFALAAISQSGDAEWLARLRELWNSAEEQERRWLVEAWASDAAFTSGGQEQLSWVLATQSGLPQITAAIAVLHHGAPRDAAWARRVLVRAMKSGTTEELRLAAERAPRAAELEKVTLELAASKDNSRAVWAAMRLAFSKEHAKYGKERLVALSRSPVGEVDAARYALAVLGERAALHWLDAQLSSPEPERRLRAAVVRLEHGAADAARRVAPLLADSDASVRTRLACWLLHDDRPPFDYFHSQLRP